MSKDEIKEVGAYKRWRFNLIVLSVVAAVYILLFVGISIDLILTTDQRAVKFMILMIGFVLLIFGPFIIYDGVLMINLRKNAKDYKKIKVSIVSAERNYFSSREGGAYDCAAHYKEADTTVHFKVYMRYLSNGIDLDEGKIVEVWYNDKTDTALFANKVKNN